MADAVDEEGADTDLDGFASLQLGQDAYGIKDNFKIRAMKTGDGKDEHDTQERYSAPAHSDLRY